MMLATASVRASFHEANGLHLSDEQGFDSSTENEVVPATGERPGTVADTLAKGVRNGRA
jgi:hypothetical protein